MITDLANLGPSRLGMTDLGAGAKKGTDKSSQAVKPENASSFDKIFTEKTEAQKPATEKVDKFSKVEPVKTVKDVRTKAANPTPLPAQKGMQTVKPPVVNTQEAQKSSDADAPRTAQAETDSEEKSWDESGTVKDKRASEKVGKKSDKTAATREDVMLKFMDSMENEFGIPPTRLVEAMANLPESEQLASPEDSASQVITQLELPKDQEQKAYQLYMGMLGQLNKLPQQDPAQKEVIAATATAGGAAALMSTKQKADLLNNLLDQMNSKFFLKQELADLKNNPGSAPETTASKDLQDPAAMGSQAHLKQGLEKSAAFHPEEISKRPLQNNYVVNPQMQQKLQEHLLQKMQAENIDPNTPEAQALAQKLAALGMATAALEQGKKAEGQTNAQAMNQQGNANAAASATGLAALGLEKQSEGDDGDDLSDDGGSPKNSPFAVNPGNVQGHLGRAHTEVAGQQNQNFGAMMAAAGGAKAAGNAEAKDANVQQIMNQAQYLIKKGGGEAKVEMTPEGMGKIHMKVVLEDGKVNIQMSAETKEAKKLIESSLNELKSSLGQRHLTMEHVKVDVGNHLASENNNSESQSQQRRMDSQEQSKDQTRQMWSEFQDGNDRRSAFFDGPGLRGYGGSRPVEPLTPGSSATAEKVQRFSGSGKGRGLNLVA